MKSVVLIFPAVMVMIVVFSSVSNHYENKDSLERRIESIEINQELLSFQAQRNILKKIECRFLHGDMIDTYLQPYDNGGLIIEVPKENNLQVLCFFKT